MPEPAQQIIDTLSRCKRVLLTNHQQIQTPRVDVDDRDPNHREQSDERQQSGFAA